jgi:hypothetical protein
MAEPGKRPFWMHQLVEYILGGALVASGLQSPKPLVPSVLGGLIMLNAALTKGALGAFRAYDRKLHRVFDMVIIGACLVAVGQPWFDMDPGSRIVVLAIATVEIVVFFGSSYVEKARPPKQATAPKAAAPKAERQPIAPGVEKTGDTATDLGRTAGRVVGSGYRAIKKLGSSDDTK